MHNKPKWNTQNIFQVKYKCIAIFFMTNASPISFCIFYFFFWMHNVNDSKYCSMCELCVFIYLLIGCCFFLFMCVKKKKHTVDLFVVVLGCRAAPPSLAWHLSCYSNHLLIINCVSCFLCVHIIFFVVVFVHHPACVCILFGVQCISHELAEILIFFFYNNKLHL